MFGDTATCTYLLQEQFANGLKRIRGALEGAHFAVAGELDLSGRMRRKLGVGLPPCLVLFAAPREWMGAQGAGDPTLDLLLPIHVVVAAAGFHTEVHFLRSLPRTESGTSRVVSDLQATVSRAIEKIGMRKLED